MADGEQKSGGSWRADHSEGLVPDNSAAAADHPQPAPSHQRPPVVLKRSSGLGLPLVGLAVLAVIAMVFFTSRKPKAVSGFQDLGAGISSAANLRGHLSIRWLGNTQYKLSFVPLDPLQGAGFSFVAADPPHPLWINIRLLDPTGFAVCSKQILFHFDHGSAGKYALARPQPARSQAGAGRPAGSAEMAGQQAPEQQRESGQDIFQTRLGDNGQVAEIDAQGVLPCTSSQFKRISYWDFTTNFPTLAEQDALMKEHAAAIARAAAEARAALRRKSSGGYKSAFFQEGDDRINSYDPSTGVLLVGPGRSFLVVRESDRATASSWAANNALVHYRCDEYSNCSLTHAGGLGVISVKSLQ